MLFQSCEPIGHCYHWTQYASAPCKLTISLHLFARWRHYSGITLSSYLFTRWHLFRYVCYLRNQLQVDLWPWNRCPSHVWRFAGNIDQWVGGGGFYVILLKVLWFGFNRDICVRCIWYDDTFVSYINSFIECLLTVVYRICVLSCCVDAVSLL